MGIVEGEGRVFTRKLGKIRNLAHDKTRRHEAFARAVDLELPLLRLWQHKIATRSATAALQSSAADVSVAHGLIAAADMAARRSGCPSQGLRLGCRPFADLLEGRHWTGGPGARTRHNRNF